jgi:hypothetical protein
MQMKLFLASGATEINAIESEINKWLASLTTDVEVKHVSSAFAGIAPNSSSDPLASLVVTVWWDRWDKR